jgi:phage baseplate assembly protein W
MAYLVHRVRPQIDTLRGLALEYLGDARRWADIALLNNLPASAYGDLSGIAELTIPVDVGTGQGPGDALRTDLAVRDGAFLWDAAGNMLTVNATENLMRSLLRALTTDRGALVHHPDYGLEIGKYLGLAGTPLFLRFLKLQIEQVIMRDPRVERVTNLRVRQVAGERRIEVAATIQPVDTPDTIELVFDRSY